MTSLLRCALPGLALAAASAAHADATVCSLGELTRTVEVVYSDPGQAVPCEVIYAKPAQGTIETLWRAANEAGYCEEKAAGFVAKLESLGWDCGEAAAAEEEPAPSA